MRTHIPSSLPFSSSASRSGRSARSHRASNPAPALTRPSAGGRHELGQNFLVDRRVVERFASLTAATRGPIIELGAGSGAITRELAALGRPLTALEIDGRRADSLRREFEDHSHVTIVEADALAWRYPSAQHTIVGNVPFHLTTAIMRSLLARGGWTDAILLTQWEAARRRCGVGGSSLLTAQWDPWFTFRLHERVPARAFKPAPSVDGGVFTIERRSEPLVPTAERAAYQAFVAEVYRGKGRGLAQILRRTSRPVRAERVAELLGAVGVAAEVLPSRLTGPQWAALWAGVRGAAGGRG
ncbi:23S ribosomal RNA methyltransferase Erm [Agromyces cerinus]|uniref:23S rRNA (Adenine-N6)-dimethyltransferase n=1 Tax=Agromyces cerinus subsp. cerinus TaxID=232089 RepID=A0A1N6ESJ9_9MICO|nr:23S ribosomal RNA methyltransferase Erm [Agromyces cerinus]SIN85996.1 23S rRNA (adenine-N6)-dimethyltransferase [Agromyces cerinus subsp. cerinus]